MDDDAAPRLQGHRLLQVGAALFLLALFVGIAIPAFAVPRLGLSTHLLGITQGIFLLVLGLVWPGSRSLRERRASATASRSTAASRRGPRTCSPRSGEPAARCCRWRPAARAAATPRSSSSRAARVGGPFAREHDGSWWCGGFGSSASPIGAISRRGRIRDVREGAWADFSCARVSSSRGFAASVGAADKPEDLAQAAAESWLKLSDRRRWRGDVGAGRQALQGRGHEGAVDPGPRPACGRPLGKVGLPEAHRRARQREAARAPDGKYVVILYETVFEKKASASRRSRRCSIRTASGACPVPDSLIAPKAPSRGRMHSRVALDLGRRLRKPPSRC
jgi:hypothetical protein